MPEAYSRKPHGLPSAVLAPCAPSTCGCAPGSHTPVALIAVARKLTVLVWHLLTKESDYHWAPARLVADKMRKVELQAGYPKRHRRPDAQSNLSHAAQRDQERRLLAQAEEAYRTLVAARRLRGDAAATKGGAS
jgi:transposase